MSDGEPVGPAPSHGGAIDVAAGRLGIPSAAWLDLSTGISPFAYPIDPLPSETWHRLPLAAEEAALLAAAAEAYGAPAATIVPAPGTQAILQWLPRLRPRCRVAVVSPTYGEHADTWAAVGHTVTAVDDPAADADVVVLCNPNNPDGGRQAPETLLSVADRLAARGGWLVVDEAFADFVPEVSVAAWAGRPGLVILRSIGKAYGLAGLRLGFALGPPAVVSALKAALGPWAVSGPALTVGTRALGDHAWRDGVRRQLDAQVVALDGILDRHGLAIVGGTPLYRLITDPRVPQLHAGLARRAVWTRIFDYRPDWLRLGIPGTADDLDRLDAALAGALDG